MGSVVVLFERAAVPKASQLIPFPNGLCVFKLSGNGNCSRIAVISVSIGGVVVSLAQVAEVAPGAVAHATGALMVCHMLDWGKVHEQIGHMLAVAGTLGL